MASVNEKLRDESISHAVDLQQYSNSVVARIIALLNRADRDIAAALSAALERLPASEFTVERLESLLYSVSSLNAQAYAAVSRELTDELRRFAEAEVGFQYELFRAVVPPQVQLSAGIAQVAVEQAYAAAMARPFQGRLLKEWAASIEADKMARIRDAVRMGYVQQEPIQDIVRRVIGTRARGYSDGLIDIDRRHAEAVVRTAISHTASTVRDRMHTDNADIIKAIAWGATLDSRTSEICRVRDQKRYTCVDHKPIGHSLPWLGGPGQAHWGCRSTALPITRSWAELGGPNLPEFSPKERASMDGQVPADITYGDWLRNQSASRQDEILGGTRGALFRRGGLTIEKFYTDKGRYLSLPELKERNAAAFRRANLG